MATDVGTILNSHKVTELSKETLENVKQKIIANMGFKKRNASMRSVNSLYVRTDGTGGALFGRKSFLAMEKGRKPGRVPRDFRHIIADWIVAKGITLYSTDGSKPRLSSVAYLIAESIRKRGTLLHQMTAFDDIYSGAVKQETRKLSEKIRLMLSSEVDYLHKEIANNPKYTA